MTTRLKGFATKTLRGTALLGLSVLLLLGADRLVGSLRRDVHAVLARRDPAPAPAPAPALQVAQAERR
jgi:hypothetical protein